jgi:signal transduction histidine kinase
VEGNTPDSGFAEQLGPAGDVNGDGFADVFITEDRFDHGRGRVLVYKGSAEGLSATPGWTLTGSRIPGEWFGAWAEGVGDVNGDGYDDVIVMAKLAQGYPEAGRAEAPAVFLFLGSPSGLCREPAWHVSWKDLGVMDLFGAGRAGDVNGDGFADVYVHGMVVTPLGSRQFRVLVFHGGLSGLATTPAVSWEIENPFDTTGLRIVCAGDVNGDGYDDLLIGWPGWSGVAKSRGRVYVHHGSRQGLNTNWVWTATYELPIRKGVDDANEQFFGWSVASAGDVNGDGFADVIIGAPYADHDDVNEGLAFAYYGSPSGLSRKSDWHVESNHPHSLLGYSVSTAGDVNGDGFDDVIVGVPYATDGQYNEGAALVFLGSKNGLKYPAHWTVESDHTEQFMGTIVAGVGDVNGDGFDDVLIGAPDHLSSRKWGGRACLYYGSSNGLPFSADWSLEKPVLAAIQERLDHSSPALKWVTVAGLFVSTIVLLVAWRRAVARSRAAEQETARVLERERLARDLHDDLGASLARLSLAEGKGTSKEGERLSDQIQHALRATEQIVWAVNPANDTLESLVAFLFLQADQIFANTGIRCATNAPLNLPDRSLEPDIRKNLFLATKEALTNALKHSQAQEVKLSVDYADGALEIVIEDNGVGFSQGSTRRFGNGTKNMRQRMEAIGGTLVISSDPAGGTRLIFRVSL